MAHFRGTIQGTRGEASRLGTKNTGLQVRAQTWNWDLRVDVTHCEDGGDRARIVLEHHTTGERRPAFYVNLTTGEVIP